MAFNLPDEPPETIIDELRRAGRRLGDAQFGGDGTVSETNGGNVILTAGRAHR